MEQFITISVTEVATLPSFKNVILDILLFCSFLFAFVLYLMYLGVFCVNILCDKYN